MRLLLIIIFAIIAVPVNGVYQNERDLSSYPVFLFNMATGDREGQYYKTLGGTYNIQFTGSIVVNDAREFPEINAANYLVNQLPKSQFLWLNPAGESSVARVPEQNFIYAIRNINEINDIRTMNSVLLGLPCTNRLIQDLLYIEKESCDKYLKQTEGKVIIKQHGTTGFYTTLIITAGSPEALFETTKSVHEMTKDVRKSAQLKDKKEMIFTFPQIGQVQIKEAKKEPKDQKELIEQQKINKIKDKINQDIKKIKKKLLFIL